MPAAAASLAILGALALLAMATIAAGRRLAALPLAKRLAAPAEDDRLPAPQRLPAPTHEQVAASAEEEEEIQLILSELRSDDDARAQLMHEIRMRSA